MDIIIIAHSVGLEGLDRNAWPDTIKERSSTSAEQHNPQISKVTGE